MVESWTVRTGQRAFRELRSPAGVTPETRGLVVGFFIGNRSGQPIP